MTGKLGGEIFGVVFTLLFYQYEDYSHFKFLLNFRFVFFQILLFINGGVTAGPGQCKVRSSSRRSVVPGLSGAAGRQLGARARGSVGLQC